mmetsp:Transcript_31570/g.76534  ORF Transcript_31570/g.76534 Transcript_31570/m.76534 type:complete len:1185 (-) Transcript_31570:186-3740(-)
MAEEKKSKSWDSNDGSKKGGGDKKSPESSPAHAVKDSADKAFLANLQAEFEQKPTKNFGGERSPPLHPNSKPFPANASSSPGASSASVPTALQQPKLQGRTKSDQARTAGHNRNVSWDVGLDATQKDNRETVEPMSGKAKTGSGDQPSNLSPPRNNQPTRPRQLTTAQGRQSSLDSSVSQNTPTPNASNLNRPNLMSQPSKSRLELEADAILFELQAETNLVRDLDRTNPLRPRAGTGASVLSEVPMEDDHAHNFVIEDDKGLVLNRSSSSKDSNSVPNSPPSGNSQGNGNRARTNSRDASSRTGKSTAVSGKARHRRANTNTVEETLFGLNSAWEEMKTFDKTGSQPAAQTIPTQNDVYSTAEMLFNRKTGKKDQAPSDIEQGDMDVIAEGDVEENSDEVSQQGGDSDQDASAQSGKGPDRRKNWLKKHQTMRPNPFKHLPYSGKIKKDWEVFSGFLRPRRQTMMTYARIVLFYVMIPSLTIAAILFYLAGNPPYGKCESSAGCQPRKDHASASWWVLFVGCRQVVIVILSVLTQGLLIDFFALRTTLTLRFCGPMFTLFIVQSKGWPCCAFWWGLYNFALVVGDSPFSNHWLFWQDLIGLMNGQNPPGFVTSSTGFYRFVSVAMGAAVAVAFKRVAVGLYLGRQTFAAYSERLSQVMNEMLIIGELARFGEAIEERKWDRKSYSYSMSDERLHQLLAAADEGGLDDGMAYSVDDKTVSANISEIDEMQPIVNPEDIDKYTGLLGAEQHRRVTEMLGRWEEPKRGGATMNEVASVGAVMQFRRALAHMDTDTPFGGPFGVCDTREACVACSQALYDRLMMQGSFVNGQLHFNVIAYLATDKNGELDQQKTEQLIQMFRPDREGGITLLEFVRSIDKVYKELRLLRATVAGSAKIDKAAEAIFNIVFYGGMVVVILYAVGIDPISIFFSLSSIVLAFSFMIGSASAKYFEGVLLILGQKPYGIGDRVNFSNSESVSGSGGSQTWFVKDVTLFCTTLQLAGTGETATVANGVIAKSRIINGARSPNAILYVTLRFGIDVQYQKVETFRKAVEIFVKARPREWMSILGFRISSIEAERGYIEYSLCLMHRETWQNMAPLLNSRHTVQAYCLELQKGLDMRYTSPPLPVEFNNMSGQSLPKQVDTSYDFEGAGQAAEERMTVAAGHAANTSSTDFVRLSKMFADESD